MMSDLGLSSKHSKENIPPSTKQHGEGLIGRLGIRVFLVAFVFLVIPLMAYSWITYLNDFFFRKKALFEGLVSITWGKTRFAQQMIEDRQTELQIISSVLSQGEEDGEKSAWLPSLFYQLAHEGMTSSVFYQAFQPNGDLLCVQASEKNLLGRINLFPEEQKIAAAQGSLVFLGTGLISQAKEVFISQAVYNPANYRPIGVVTIGIDIKQWVDWISVLFASPIQFNISIVDEKGDLFFSQDPELSLANLNIFPMGPGDSGEEFFNESIHTAGGKEYLKLWHQQERRIAIRVPVTGTQFYFLLDSAQSQVTIKPSSVVVDNLIHALFFFLLIGGGMAALMTYRISRPLSALYRVMQRVEKKDLTARYTQDRMGFEINVIGHVFNRMLDSLLHHMEEARNERISRELLTKELKIGHDIQKSILPKEMPHFPGLEIATGFQGAKEVAGDFYDLFLQRPSGALFLGIADAAGKGISACLYSLCVRSMLRSFESTRLPLDQIVLQTNNLFCEDTGATGNFVTAWVGSVDPQTKKLSYSSCGHLPAMLLKKGGQVVELTTPGIALGVLPLEKVEHAQVQLEPGDVLLLYTDGIIDAQDSFFEFFGKGRLLEALKECAGLSASEIVEAIVGGVNHFAKEGAITDDRTLVVLKYSE